MLTIEETQNLIAQNYDAPQDFSNHCVVPIWNILRSAENQSYEYRQSVISECVQIYELGRAKVTLEKFLEKC